MPYSELIKNFERIRDYIRDFYVYGFKTREEYDTKSARSYDNERRRIESWLGDYMFFRQVAEGRNVFLSMDSRSVSLNPLYSAFLSKSFTALDITLHFIILDALSGDKQLSVRELTECIEADYLSAFDNPPVMDESTLRKKLKEYESLGLLKSAKRGKELIYGRTDSEAESIDLKSWRDALAFYSEIDPLGVVGSYLLNKLESIPDYYSFKHHYILHALESEILYALLLAMGEHRDVELSMFRPHRNKASQTVLPLKIHVSAQGGRRYLMAFSRRFKKIELFRLDFIRSVKPLEPEPEYEKYAERAERFLKNLWGASAGTRRLTGNAEHIEMTVRVDDGEEHIPMRLEREKRCGRVEIIDKHTYKFVADVYDASEMLPWLRTFIGRIISLSCGNPRVTEVFYADIAAMNEMYGGDKVALQ
ncbi:WYL domain-containing protein [Synergistales bacterium]|nr:WYL domain-containing protein [Synergistales bacterium]